MGLSLNSVLKQFSCLLYCVICMCTRLLLALTLEVKAKYESAGLVLFRSVLSDERDLIRLSSQDFFAPVQCINLFQEVNVRHGQQLLHVDYLFRIYALVAFSGIRMTVHSDCRL